MTWGGGAVVWLVLAAVTILLAIGYAFRTGVRMVKVYVPLADAVMVIKLETSLGHLWLEEYLGGDKKPSIAEARKHFEDADWYARAMLEGGENEEGKFYPLDDPEMREGIQNVRAKLAEFRQITKERLKVGRAAAAGGALDEQYDAVFREFMDQADEVEADLRKVIARDTIRFQWVLGSLVGLSAVSFIAAGWTIHRRTAQRWLAESRYAAERDKLVNIVAGMGAGMTILDSDLRVTWTNEIMQKWFGSMEEIAGVTCDEIFHQDQYQSKCACKRAMQNGEVTRGEPFEYTIDERERYFQILAVPIKGEQGEIVQVVLMTADVTDVRLAELERQNFEARMQHAQKLESLGVLAGGIAHDFNNLLVAILGNADLALMEISPQAPERSSIMEVKEAAMRAADLANQMLAYSGKGKFIVEALSLNGLVEEMGHLLEASISKKITLRYELADDTPPINADASQVRQVVMNLITNASDAIGDESGVIAIRTGFDEIDRQGLSHMYLAEDLPPGRYVSLEVSDTGCGMDDETKAKLFEPFFTTKFTGRGLGLAAVLGIIRGHHGTIQVDSQVGRGTTFRILLPVSEESITMPNDYSPDTLAEAIAGGTVLIVDDEQTVRKMSQRMLEHVGCRVLTAGDGYEAVRIYGEKPDEIDVVLLDMTMPGLDGEETFRELKRIRPGVQVVLSSGYSEGDATHRLAEAGLAGFIQKPYELAELVGILHAAMHPRIRRDSA